MVDRMLDRRGGYSIGDRVRRFVELSRLQVPLQIFATTNGAGVERPGPGSIRRPSRRTSRGTVSGAFFFEADGTTGQQDH